MLPPALFRRRAFTTATAVAATMNLCSNGTLFVLTLYLQDVEHRSPLQAALTCLPAFAMLSLAGPPAGRAVARYGPQRPLAAGLATAGAGLVLLAAGPSVPAFVLWGAGLGVMTPAIVAAAMGAVEPARAGLAAAVNNTARQAGTAVGIAIGGALAANPPGDGLPAIAAGAGAIYLLAAIPATRGIRARRRPRSARDPRPAAESAP
jgi:DHA2 family methylenomycin A resistance protein-like MFS transporter